jgi:hypothetical protein
MGTKHHVGGAQTDRMDGESRGQNSEDIILIKPKATFVINTTNPETRDQATTERSQVDVEKISVAELEIQPKSK